MGQLKGSFFTGWKLANQIRQNKVLKNFFYFNSLEDRNIFFLSADYNEDATLQLQLKQNVNIFIDIKDKKTFTIENKGKTEEYDLQQTKKLAVDVIISIFSYNPTAILNENTYHADVGDNITCVMDYFELVNCAFEREFHLLDPMSENGNTNGIPFLQKQYEFQMIVNDIIQEKDMEEGQFYLDKINSVKSK